MNGPQHYKRSEEIVEHGWDKLTETASLAASGQIDKDELDSQLLSVQVLMIAAQVHATLSAAAASAEQTQSQMFTMNPEWHEALYR